MFFGHSATCIEIGDSDDDGVFDAMPITFGKSPSSAGWAVGLAIFVIPLGSASKARRAIWISRVQHGGGSFAEDLTFPGLSHVVVAQAILPSALWPLFQGPVAG